MPITPETASPAKVEGVAEKTYFMVDVSRSIGLLRQGFNVLAVEVHQDSPDSPDLCFDAELCGNVSIPQFPPNVEFLSPADGSLHLLGRPIPLAVDAIDPDGPIAAVTYLVGGEVIGSAQQPPYRITWQNAPPGRHQITARARDTQGNVGEGYLTVQVLSNLPPLVAITSPANDSTFAPSNRITVVAAAVDIGGAIQRVDFYRKEHMHSFNEPEVFLGSSTTPPYMVETANLEPGHYFIWADATDDQGLMTRSGVVMIEIAGGGLRLDIRWMVNHVMIMRPAGSILQESDTPAGPWKDLLNASNPTMVFPLEKAKFYRAYLP